MKILLFGSTGQVGWQLRRSLAVLGEVIALDRHAEGGDLGDLTAIAAKVAAVRPDVVVNAAAYTAVDRAEDEPRAAAALNEHAPRVLAEASREAGAWLVHYSSDYVYPGTGDRPWREDDEPAPLSVYGRSKLAGDRAVAAGNPRHLVFRTSWIYDSFGQNFAKSILKAAAARDELKVVADQWGAPTRAALIADVTAHAVRVATSAGSGAHAGVYHVAAEGATTWHEYATLLVSEAARLGMPLRTTAARVLPIATGEYPAKARRPANSRLDTARLRSTFGLMLPPWQDGARAVVAELAHHRADAPT